MTQIIRNVTGLPTGGEIENYLMQVIRGNSNWVYIDVKIVNFDPFKEVYSWQKGDEVLVNLSQLLQEVWQGDFVGHPGGDNFIVISEKAEYKSHLDALSERFSEAIQEFYQETDMKSGFIFLNGVEKPLMSLSYGVFDNAQTKVKAIREVTKLAAEDRRRKDLNYVANQEDDQDILMEW
jgi:GGDEF domain-containing protein